MRIIQPRQVHHDTYYQLSFDYEGEEPGCGFSFDCNEKGEINEDELKTRPAAWENYQACLLGKVKIWENLTFKSADGSKATVSTAFEVEKKILAPKIIEFKNRWSEPAIGECNGCGQEVMLIGFTNPCDCGLDYNMSGQELCDRSQWGEETGETADDILRGGNSFDSDY